jgi:N-acetylneuraminic acid mutarotase
MRYFLLLSLCAMNLCIANETSVMQWSKLRPLPDREGFAAPFAGVSGGALIVAGGANIPGEKWGDSFKKVWSDSVFILEAPGGDWRTGFRLPRKLGYGVSVSSDDSVLCFGGSDETTHYADGFRLRWVDEDLAITPLPPLPRTCANACGALVGRTVYIAGGIEAPNSTNTMRSFWSLDLGTPNASWKELEPWPGPGRMLAVSGVLDGDFYLFSGADLSIGAHKETVRTYLKDAYRYRLGIGWKRIADLPRAAVAAPSEAAVIDGSLVLFSGDDGVNVHFTPVSEHPGFPRTALAYDAAKDVWTEIEGVPFSRVTTPAVRWRDQLVIPNGETRVRVRTPEVWSLVLPIR